MNRVEIISGRFGAPMTIIKLLSSGCLYVRIDRQRFAQFPKGRDVTLQDCFPPGGSEADLALVRRAVREWAYSGLGIGEALRLDRSEDFVVPAEMPTWGAS